DRIQRLLVPGYRPALRLTWRAMLTALLLGSALLVLSAMGTRVTVAQIITTPKQPAKPSGSAANNIGNTNRPPFEITAGESAFDASTGIGTYSNNVVIKDVFLKGTNFTMRADSATMNTKTGELNANGHVVIQRGEDTIRGSSIRYNFKTGAMEVKSVGALTRTSAGRQAIMAKLNRIRLASVSFDAQPLSEVVRQLSQQIRLNDPQSNGINLLINFPSDVGIAPSSPQIDPATGLPVSNTVAPAFAPESVLITILPPMTNARVADVLEAVVNGANKPIKYALLDYGIAFSPKGPETPALHTRTFRVDTGKFISALGVPAGVTNSGRWQAAILNFFSKAGADLGPESGKNVFFSDGSGALLVRATAKELTSIEQFLVLHELMTVNPATNSPSINFASKTVVPIPKVAVADKSRSGELIVRGMEEENAFTNWNSEATQKAGTNSTNLLTREFVLDVNTFVLNLEKSGAFGANSTAPKTDRESVQAALLHYFTKGGVDLSPEAGKSLFYNNRNGRLLVRTTPSDLDSVEGLVHSLNYAPPQINIKVKFVTVPNKGFDEFLGALGITNQIGNSSTQQVTGILTPTQFRSVLSTLEKRPGTSLLSEGQVTTLIGRQAQIQSVDLKHYVIGKTNGVPETMEIPTGQILDVVSFTNSYADGDSVQLRATSSLVEFLGYDDPGKFAIAGSDGKTTTNPIPRFRERQMNADAVLWDGQTLVLAGAPASNVQLVKDKSPLLGDIPFLGKMFRKEHATTQTNQVIVFVTATIIDSAGNRVHPDKDPK
ncbi:MAG TPA: hypothetical protein VK327_15420, partial [Candidatus Paceibacterota bacterium]|nr:hypothetical protein [Candidatus Paceibacterota bacterium]